MKKPVLGFQNMVDLHSIFGEYVNHAIHPQAT